MYFGFETHFRLLCVSGSAAAASSPSGADGGIPGQAFLAGARVEGQRRHTAAAGALLVVQSTTLHALACSGKGSACTASLPAPLGIRKPDVLFPDTMGSYARPCASPLHGTAKHERKLIARGSALHAHLNPFAHCVENLLARQTDPNPFDVP